MFLVGGEQGMQQLVAMRRSRSDTIRKADKENSKRKQTIYGHDANKNIVRLFLEKGLGVFNQRVLLLF